MPPTTIRYTLTRNDLFRANVRMFFRNRIIIGLYVIIFVSLFWQSFTAEDVTGSIAFRSVVASLTAFIGCLFSGGITLLYLFIITFRKNVGVLGDHEIQLTPDGLLETTAANQTINRWGAFHRSFTTANYLYIYVTDTQAHIIPLRYFQTPQQLVSFQSEIQSFAAAAKSTPAPPISK